MYTSSEEDGAEGVGGGGGETLLENRVSRREVGPLFFLFEREILIGKLRGSPSVQDVVAEDATEVTRDQGETRSMETFFSSFSLIDAPICV